MSRDRNFEDKDSQDDQAKKQLDDLIASDIGSRHFSPFISKLFFVVSIAWSVFQLYNASPLPLWLDVFVLDDTQQRSIHLAFALFLAFLAYPAFRNAQRDTIPWFDWGLTAIAIACSLYIVVFYADVASRSGGVRTGTEIAVSIVGILCVLEITRRALGTPLVIVAAIFTAYAFLGPHMPSLIAHKGVTLNRFVDHMWLTTEGVFGLPLGVSNSYIFLFVLFGALLDKAGAGNFFIKLSFALLGHMRGGPAKAAVVSSALTGLISGSAIANIVTTGTFTIPLMKRIGYPAEKAAAIEVSSSINGQIMPPVMGAAAFLMTEFVGITYFEVCKHAFLPAVISYIALFYIVHLEAVKADMPVLKKVVETSLFHKLFVFATAIVTILALSMAVYYGIMGLKVVFGEAALTIGSLAMVAIYLLLLFVASRQPDLEMDDPNEPLVEIPRPLPVLLAGMHFLLPVIVLIWCLMIDRLSPGLAVSWAIVALGVLVLTQKPVILLVRGQGMQASAITDSLRTLLDGLAAGARNMAGVAVAMASAGIIVGVVSLTGLGLLMTEIIDTISYGNVFLMLLFTAIMCIVLGMGMPTTANYIVVASVMAQPFVTLAAQHGIIVPLIGVHLFVFYFGLISGTTPPVAVDAFAGAALARADPMKTCIISFFYSMRTAVLPFIFIFNPQLLLIGVDTWWHFLLVLGASVIGMLAFAAATQGYFLVRSRIWESVALLFVVFTLLRPGFWLDLIKEPFDTVDPKRLVEMVQRMPNEASIRMIVSGENFSGEAVRKVVLLPLGQKGSDGKKRLAAAAGMDVIETDGRITVDTVRLNGAAQHWGIGDGWTIEEIQVPTERFPKEWFFMPGIGLLLLIMGLQNRRRTAIVA
ncbi:TRAP transporter permease [Shumkonia mesophila]|uniref:TRAP transporter permease n=1 Tax=Shumkonia mesophila TaxID=2838854 RepID=UPI00293466AD|nr:TRAP transporter permease [Shumkonia mesophila]